MFAFEKKEGKREGGVDKSRNPGLLCTTQGLTGTDTEEHISLPGPSASHKGIPEIGGQDLVAGNRASMSSSDSAGEGGY